MSSFKYISIEEIPTTHKTKVWMIRNNKSGDRLGIIRWWGPWRQYCFFPNPAIFNVDCMNIISAFIKTHWKDRNDTNSN